MKLVIFGTGDVGLRNNIFLIYELNLWEIIIKNLEDGRLALISIHEEVLKEVDVIYITVGTPENEGESANLTLLEEVVTTIALTAKKDTIVVTKSTVPVGTNDRLLQIIDHNKLYHINFEIVLFPKFFKACTRYWELCFMKVSKGFTQIADRLNVKNNHHFSVNSQLHVSLESWCG